MAREAIHSILEAEEKAKQILQQARDERSKILVQGQEKAEEEKRRIEQEALEEASRVRLQVEEKTKQEMEETRADANRQAKELDQIPDEDLQEAVSRIVEEVKKYGNS